MGDRRSSVISVGEGPGYMDARCSFFAKGSVNRPWILLCRCTVLFGTELVLVDDGVGIKHLFIRDDSRLLLLA
jgi:hypothetical protein